MSETNVQQTNPAPKIYAAMAAVMSEIGAISKDQTNDHQRYKFRGIDNVYNAVHSALVKHKVFNVPKVLERTETLMKLSGGKDAIRVVNKMVFTFYADDGSSIEMGPIYGEAFDTGDKATNKANSACHKYLFLMGFCIPTEDSDDADSSSPEIQSRGEQQKTQQQQQQQQRKPVDQKKQEPQKQQQQRQQQQKNSPPKNDSKPAPKKQDNTAAPGASDTINSSDAKALQSIGQNRGWTVEQMTSAIVQFTGKKKWGSLTYAELDFVSSYFSRHEPKDLEEAAS